jgi:micrococcal nuclease
VTLEFDEDSADPYGRALAYVWVSDLGGELFNETLVREGQARVLTVAPNDKYEERFLAAEKEARDEGIGVWATDPCSTPEPTMLKSGGSAHGPLPLLPGGGCPSAYPVERDGACHR